MYYFVDESGEVRRGIYVEFDCIAGSGNCFQTYHDAEYAAIGLERVGWKNLQKIGAAEIGDPFTELISRYQQMRTACYYLWDISRHRGTDADIPMRVVANTLFAIADRCGFREGSDNLFDWLGGTVDESAPAAL